MSAHNQEMRPYTAPQVRTGVTTRCARRSWRDPTGESPVRVRRSEPPGNECCGRHGNVGSEAYTVIEWGVGLSHELTTLWRPRPPCETKATCVVPLSRGAIAPTIQGVGGSRRAQPALE